MKTLYEKIRVADAVRGDRGCFARWGLADDVVLYVSSVSTEGVIKVHLRDAGESRVRRDEPFLRIPSCRVFAETASGEDEAPSQVIINPHLAVPETVWVEEVHQPSDTE